MPEGSGTTARTGGRPSLEVIDLVDTERPPIINVPEHLIEHPRSGT